MKARWLLAIVWATCLVVQPVDAKSKRKPKTKPAVEAAASKQTTVAVERLMQPFKWGMTPQQVIKILEQDVRKQYDKELKAASGDPIAYDKIRRNMIAATKKVGESYVKFAGKRVPWDVSMVEREFAHKNNEAMLVRWTSEDRRFYFFHNERLWKVFIAFNAEMFEGKTFKDFSEAMEARFGRAERKYKATLKGDATMAHLAWPPSATSLLRALDNTKIYGNFCLVLMDRAEYPRVREGRKLNSPKKDYGEPLVDAVLSDNKPPASSGNEDIVDQITGRGPAVPAGFGGSDSQSEPAPSRGSTAEPSSSKKNKKKVDSKNPLDGIDL